MRLTGGVITYSERRTIAQYEHKDCKIELAFAFAEGEPDVPAFLDTIQAEIRSRCLSMLGLGHPTPPPATKPMLKATEAAPTIADAIPTVEPVKARKARAPKLAVVEEAPPADEPADDFDFDEAPAVEKISDQAVMDAAKKAGAKVGMPAARKALEEFTTLRPATCSSVPQEKRAAALAKFAELAK